MNNIPERIFLQIGDEDDLHPDNDFQKEAIHVTWHTGKINDNDIEYKLVGKEDKKESEASLWADVRDIFKEPGALQVLRKRFIITRKNK